VCKEQGIHLVVFGTDKETEDRTWYNDWGTDWRIRGLTADRVNDSLFNVIVECLNPLLFVV